MSEASFDLRAPTATPIPLIVSVPHCGTELSPGLAERLQPEVRRDLPDTDWHLQRLYDFVPALGGVLLTARFSRYVIDLNRDPEARPLYPGRFETGLVPTETFDRAPVYLEGQGPDAAELARRRAQVYQPYHDRLQGELARLRECFGSVCLFEAHAIRSEVPAFFEGCLPEFVVGDAGGRSCGADRSEAFREVLAESGGQVAHNTPFQGGFITRAYGDPAAGVHALQLEMPLSNYLSAESPPWLYADTAARSLKVRLAAALRAFVCPGP